MAKNRAAKPRQFSNGQWCAAVGPPDKRGKASVVYFPRERVKTERDAWKFLEELLAEQSRRKVSTDEPTVYWLSVLYLAWAETRVAAGKMSPHHYRCHVSRFTLICEAEPVPGSEPLRDRLATSVTPDDLGGCVEAWEAAGYSANYVRGLVRAIRSAYRWGSVAMKGRDVDDPARPMKWIHEDTLAGYRPPALPECPDRYVDGAVVRRFLRWSWARARVIPAKELGRRFDRLYLLMVWFMRLTGCRPGEAIRLRWQDLDWVNEVVRRPGKATAKTGKLRVLDLTPPVARLLRVIERLPGHHPVFVFTHMRGKNADARGELDPIAGEPWPDGSSAAKKMKHLRDAALAAQVAGLVELGPKRIVQYSARHAYASNALMKGLTSSEAAELLGNTSAMVEKVYGHIQRDHTRRLARELADRRGSSSRSPGGA